MASQNALTGDAVELQQADPRAESSNLSATINPHEIGPPEAQGRAGDSLTIPPTLLVRRPQNVFTSAGLVFTWTNGILGGFNKLKERKSEVMTKTLAIIAIIVACFALWPTFSSAKDGRKATLIAEWTAKKDFLEFCQSINYKDSGCDKAKGVSLGPPPNFSGSDWKRFAEASGDHASYHNWNHNLPTQTSVHTYGLVTPLAAFTACGLLLFWKYGSLRRLRRLPLRSHFRSKNWQRSIYNWEYKLSQGTMPVLHAGVTRDFRDSNNQAVTRPSTAKMSIEAYSNVQFDFEFRPENYVRGETTGLDKRRTKLTKRRIKSARQQNKSDSTPSEANQAEEITMAPREIPEVSETRRIDRPYSNAKELSTALSLARDYTARQLYQVSQKRRRYRIASNKMAPPPTSHPINAPPNWEAIATIIFQYK
ncbi:hypothetical protein DL765_001083 [Monosporascus sp. GIB2]|nr:hypothetical protein DL765_001083 [Monosporascus sp. GIB2]